MTYFKIENKILDYDSFWFHYKAEVEKAIGYEVFVDLKDIEMINIIEKYGGCSIHSKELTKNILHKDRINGSMGLLWNIFRYLEEHEKLSKPAKWDYVLRNINHVFVSNEKLIIKGDASYWIAYE
jgi:hypothetical protein